MTIDLTSSDGSAMQSSDPQPVKGNAPIGAMPEKPTVTLEEVLAQLEESKRTYAKLENEHRTASGELKRHRERLGKIDQADKEAKEAELSEVERLKKQHSELQSQHEAYTRQAQERIVRYEVQAQATELGIIDPDAAVKLLDWSQLEYDESGTPTNAKELLEELVKKKKYLLASPATQQQPTTQQRSVPSIPAMHPERAVRPASGLPPGKHTLGQFDWSK